MTASPSAPAPSAPLDHYIRHVAHGGLMCLPTDTVYGIGCAAHDGQAVARLLAAKGRGRQMPPPVLVSNPADLEGIIAPLPPAAQRLCDALIAQFWPGALTIICPAHPDLDWDLGETGGTIAVRMPDHPLTRDLLQATGPMAVTSANLTGQPPAISAEQAAQIFASRPDIEILDGGATPGPIPSSIVAISWEGEGAPAQLRIIRHGRIEDAQILAVAQETGAQVVGAATEG